MTIFLSVSWVVASAAKKSAMSIKEEIKLKFQFVNNLFGLCNSVSSGSMHIITSVIRSIISILIF
jgi:hypothetical protein